MKLLFKVFLLSRPQERGFVLPVIIALGLIMTLVGTISIFQSSDEQLTASSQRATAKALAAAEIGVARYRELIDKNKIIAFYNACESWDDKGDTDPANDVCGDSTTSTTIFSWFNAANIPNINASCSANLTQIAAGPTKNWQNITSGSPANGQFRLIDYKYNPNYDNNSTPGDTSDDTDLGQPIGTLTVEGRVNQSNTNSTEEQAAVARVEVDLPIQPGIPSPEREIIKLEDNFNNLNPALWITGDVSNSTVEAAVTNVSGLKVQGNIIVTDTNCSISNTIPTDANLVDSNNQFVLINPTRPMDSTSIYKYPRVDVDGDGTDEVGIDWNPNVDGKGNNDINLLSGIDAPITLPRGGDLSETRPDGSIYYHYVVDGDINLNNENIVIGPGRKVILYVKGDITLTANGSGDSVNINAGNNNNKSYNLEIYGTNDNQKITFAGDGSDGGEINIKALIYAPNAQVEVLADPTVVIDGAVWVEDWKGTSLTNDVTIQPDDPGNPTLISEQYFNYTYIKNDLVNLEVRLVDPIISVPSRWETQEAE